MRTSLSSHATRFRHGGAIRRAAACAVIGLAAGCFRDTRVTATLRVPGMRSEACAERVRTAFANLDRATAHIVSVNLEAGTVVVTFDSTQIAIRNLQHRIAEAGFDCDDIPAYGPDGPGAAPAAPPED